MSGIRQRMENVLVFTTENVDLLTATNLEFYIRQRSGVFFKYTPEVISNTSVKVVIPYEDAKEMMAGEAEVQLALTTEGGTPLGTDVQKIRVKRLINCGGYPVEGSGVAIEQDEATLTFEGVGIKGDPGKDGTPCTHEWNGTVLTVTSASGTSSADLKGEPGKDGTTPATTEKLGAIKVGENLKITEDGVLSVDTADAVEQDNTKPITSAAVHLEIGNIEVLLAAL